MSENPAAVVSVCVLNSKEARFSMTISEVLEKISGTYICFGISMPLYNPRFFDTAN